MPSLTKIEPDQEITNATMTRAAKDALMQIQVFIGIRCGRRVSISDALIEAEQLLCESDK